jgi:hypothetical protein
MWHPDMMLNARKDMKNPDRCQGKNLSRIIEKEKAPGQTHWGLFV